MEELITWIMVTVKSSTSHIIKIGRTMYKSFFGYKYDSLVSLVQFLYDQVDQGIPYRL